MRTASLSIHPLKDIKVASLLASVNRVSVNKVSVNKVGVNRVSVDRVTVNTTSIHGAACRFL